MDIPRTQQVRLDNFKAHYNKLLSDIQTANRQLSDVYGEVQVSKVNLAKLQSEQLSTGRSLADAQKALSTTMEARQQSMRLAEEGVTKAEERKVQVENEKKALVGELRHDVAAYGAKISELKESISGLDKERLSIEYSISKLEGKLRELNHEITIKDMTLESRNKSILAADEDVKTLNKRFNENKERNIETLANIKSKIEDKLPELDRRNKSLAEREVIVDKREKDAAVLVRRIQKIYKKHYPHITLEL